MKYMKNELFRSIFDSYLINLMNNIIFDPIFYFYGTFNTVLVSSLQSTIHPIIKYNS